MSTQVKKKPIDYKRFRINFIMFKPGKLLLYLFFWNIREMRGHPKNLAWSGGPLHCECEHGVELWTNAGKYVKHNVVAIKAVTFNDEIYVITPRFKSGVLATIWLVLKGRRGVELEAFPSVSAHAWADCESVQNAVDCHLDHLGNLWVLDTGIVETVESPRCTCPPKIVVFNVILKKMTKNIKLSTLVDATTQLQNIVVEYDITGKVYVYVSDASRGAVLVYDVSSNDGWTVLVCSPAPAIQLAVIKRGLHNSLMLIRMNQKGLLEIDTAALKRKHIYTPLTVLGENEVSVFLLGFDAHHLYLRHTECADVLSWDTRKAYNKSNVVNIHSAGPHMVPTSVSSDHLKNLLVVLDSNYADTLRGKRATYHKLTFIGQI